MFSRIKCIINCCNFSLNIVHFDHILALFIMIHLFDHYHMSVKFDSFELSLTSFYHLSIILIFNSIYYQFYLLNISQNATLEFLFFLFIPHR